MYKLSYNKDKNRIYIYVENNVEDYELGKYTEELLGLIDKTHPGFTVCADLTRCDTSFIKNANRLQRIREYGCQKGLDKAVHILSEQALKEHGDTPFEGVRYAFSSMEDAEKFLDGN